MSSPLPLSSPDQARLLQWFGAVQDLNPAYLEPEDHQLAERLRGTASEGPPLPTGGGIRYRIRDIANAKWHYQDDPELIARIRAHMDEDGAAPFYEVQELAVALPAALSPAPVSLDAWMALGEGVASYPHPEAIGLHPPSVSAAAPSPHAWREREFTQILEERDRNCRWADKLADAIAEHFGVDIGEHSSDNNPWQQALEAFPAHEGGEA